MIRAILIAAAVAVASPALAQYEVVTRDVSDRKAVFATTASTDITPARVRLAGTVTSLTVDEGMLVEKGERIAVVIDEKLPFQLAAIDAVMESLAARRNLARTSLARTSELRSRGTVSQARLDEAQTELNVVVSEIAAKRAEREVLEQRREEGDVLAPTSGRVLAVNAVEGAVVQPGEVIAEIATDNYVLRLHLPERHARFISEGDTALIGSRGASMSDADLREGTIVKVYPQLENGQVVADVQASGVTDYFVGERIRVWVSTGTRRTITVPEEYVFNRFGVDYVRVKTGDGAIDVVIQTGQRLSVDGEAGIEVLSGLVPGDILVTP